MKKNAYHLLKKEFLITESELRNPGFTNTDINRIVMEADNMDGLAEKNIDKQDCKLFAKIIDHILEKFK